MTKYAPGDLLTLKSGMTWKVDRLGVTDGRGSISLVNPSNHKHGTAFYKDVLDGLVVDHHRPGLFRKSPQDTPAVNGDGDVPVRLSYDTDYGECTVSGRISKDELGEMIERLAGTA